MTRPQVRWKMQRRSASTNSLRVVMLICLVTLCRSRRTIRRVANYVRQQVSTGSSSDESMRGEGLKSCRGARAGDRATATRHRHQMSTPLDAPLDAFSLSSRKRPAAPRLTC